jgi:hypothetical protein
MISIHKQKNKIHKALAKVSNVSLPNPSHQGRGTHPYTPLKRGFVLSPCGRGVK